MAKNKIKALVIGSFGASNIGDEAILSQMLRHLPYHHVSVLSGNPSDTRRRHKIKKVYPHLPFGPRSLFKTNWRHSLRVMKKSDLVLLGGGGLFVDNESPKAVLLWAWHFLVAKMYRKKVILFLNSIGPLNSMVGRMVSSWVFRSADNIILRDQLSERYLNKAADLIASDAVFMHPAPKKSKRKKRVLLNLKPWRMNLGLIEKSVLYLEGKGYEVLYLANDNSDRSAFESLPTRPLLQPKSLQELMQLMSESELAIGMRLHFYIAALISKTPLVALSYSLKCDALLDELAHPYVRVNALSKGKLMKLIKSKPKPVNIEKQKQAAQEAFDFLESLNAL
jgi:polysaccharide pyruvyl transferase CsaB